MREDSVAPPARKARKKAPGSPEHAKGPLPFGKRPFQHAPRDALRKRSGYTIFFPNTAAISRSSATRSVNWAGVSCCGPSDRATCGFG